MFLLGILVFLVAEIAAFVAVGEHVGFGWAVLILIGVSAIGPFVVRRVGLGVLSRTRDRLAQGELPTRELLDGVVVLFGGAMICVPGFLTDTVGLMLMVRPVRNLLIRKAGHRLAHRVQTMQDVRFNVINVGVLPNPGNSPNQTDPPTRMIEPGEGIDD